MVSEPRQITAGDSVAWDRSFSDYPPSAGWALNYYLVKAGTELITITTTIAGEVYTASIVPDTTSAYAPGIYRWSAVVSKGSERKTVDSGPMEVLHNPAVVYDPRTNADRCLAAVEAALGKRIGDPMLSYKIDGIEAVKIPHADLIRLRAFYAAKVRRQNGEGFFKVFRV